MIFEIFANAFTAKFFVGIRPNQQFHCIVRQKIWVNPPMLVTPNLSLRSNSTLKIQFSDFFNSSAIFLGACVRRSCQCNVMHNHTRKRLLSASCIKFQYLQVVKIIKLLKFLRGKYSNFSQLSLMGSDGSV